MAQVSFDPLVVFDFDMAPKGDVWCCASAKEAHARARRARDAFLRGLRKEFPVQEFRGWALTGQLNKYRALGVEDGRSRTVYMLDAYDMDWQVLRDLKERFLRTAGVSA